MVVITRRLDQAFGGLWFGAMCVSLSLIVCPTNDDLFVETLSTVGLTLILFQNQSSSMSLQHSISRDQLC